MRKQLICMTLGAVSLAGYLVQVDEVKAVQPGVHETSAYIQYDSVPVEEYRGGRPPLTVDPQSVKPQTEPCYPSCQYEALLEMTPEEREAIGAAKYMQPFERK